MHDAAQFVSVVDRLLNTPDKLLFASTDLEETRDRVAKVMKPHGLSQTLPHESLNARMHHIPLGELSLNRLCYGAHVSISPGALEDFYLVQMPLRGHARIGSKHAWVDSVPDVASVLSPHVACHMHWSHDSDQLMLRFSRSLVERTLAAYLGRDLDKPLCFQLGFRWRQCSAWYGLLNYLFEAVLQNPTLGGNPLVVGHLEQLTASILLTTHTHSYSDASDVRASAVLPRHVRRAQEYLQANAHEAVSASELAQIAGVSVRSLYAGFKEFLGVSPMHYLRRLRLERAREELLTDDAAQVAGVAMRWGFSHLGRFSREYKNRYGEAPSQTLRRR